MAPLLALTIIFFVYAVGDIVATKTKAVISMLLICSVIFLLAFWCGLPADIFSTSGLSTFAGVTICMFLVHIGSTIKVMDFIKEWRTVAVVLISTLAISFGVYFVCSLIMDRYYALVGGPCLAGGMVAYLIMQSVGDSLGRAEVSVFALAGRFLGFSPVMSLAVAITALFGFPGTFLISREVSAAVGETEEEVKLVMDYLMPKMIIAGIVSVSVVSGLAAGVMSTWI